jgi:tetratricopeptide (TPR) repeat protein
LAVAYRNALAIYRARGDKDNENVLLVNIGTTLSRLGGLKEGVAAFQEAVAVCRAADDKNAEGEALFRLGSFLMDGLQVSAACTAHQRAVEIWREIGNRHREGIELMALANALRAAGRRAAAERAAGEAVEALLDGGDLTGAAAAQDFIDKLPERSPEELEPEGPTASTVQVQGRSPGFGGCYTVLTVVAIPFIHYFDGPWWILAAWAVLAPFLQLVLMVGFPVEERRADVSTPEMNDAIRFAKGCLFLVLALAAAAAFGLGGPWWLLAFCTVLSVVGVNGKARLPLYALIGGVTAYYLWGTWWALLALLIPALGMMSRPKPAERAATPIEIG